MVKNSCITPSDVLCFFSFFKNPCLITFMDEIMSIFGFLALRFTGCIKNRPDPTSFRQFRGFYTFSGYRYTITLFSTCNSLQNQPITFQELKSSQFRAGLSDLRVPSAPRKNNNCICLAYHPRKGAVKN